MEEGRPHAEVYVIQQFTNWQGYVYVCNSFEPWQTASRSFKQIPKLCKFPLLE